MLYRAKQAILPSPAPAPALPCPSTHPEPIMKLLAALLLASSTAQAGVVYNWQTTYDQPWPFFRLAEIYMNYAEAKFELGDEATAREYINKVRARPSVDMPPIPNTVTGEALRQRLYNERRIESAFEGHRFFDIRRWKIANIIENRPIYGMDIVKNLTTGVTTYTPVLLLQKNLYTDKMNLLPVETSEVIRNSPDLQTPGW